MLEPHINFYHCVPSFVFSIVAMEILAEVFCVRTSEVEEMIRQRSEERELWPERFWMGE